MGEDFEIENARIEVLNYSSEEWIEMLYQKSFQVEWINSKIKSMWWREVEDLINSEHETIVIDCTLVYSDDISILELLLLQSDRVSVCFETTKEYRSTHNVPEKVMNEYKLMIEKTRKRIKKIVDKFEYI